jgi:hypothetical protein
MLENASAPTPASTKTAMIAQKSRMGDYSLSARA